ncbi:MAG: hypothetical protein IT285_16090 [Bdellovibrionales bacterium]|nr:hypothetical protein [Bdellovibrionales bacterium]
MSEKNPFYDPDAATKDATVTIEASKLAALRAENARLRGVLERIADNINGRNDAIASETLAHMAITAQPSEDLAAIREAQYAIREMVREFEALKDAGYGLGTRDSWVAALTRLRERFGAE